jgi:protein-L-isoaspartate(D-aspartate) O-methyltransferase
VTARQRWTGFCAAVAVGLSSPACTRWTTSEDNDSLSAARRRLVERDLRGEGITDESVLAAIAKVPRHEFVPAYLRSEAYADRALPIGEGQTISQPFVVALMSEKLGLRPGDKVLEIGTGSGYQAAVLAELGCDVYSVEILPDLADSARHRLERLGYAVHVRAGDGFFGWPEMAPFDAVIITAASPEVPETLVQQLRDGGRIILPLGPHDGQTLTLGIKGPRGLDLHALGGVAFVPMTGEVRKTNSP